jgi:hypothetical protein
LDDYFRAFHHRPQIFWRPLLDRGPVRDCATHDDRAILQKKSPGEILWIERSSFFKW